MPCGASIPKTVQLGALADDLPWPRCWPSTSWGPLLGTSAQRKTRAKRDEGARRFGPATRARQKPRDPFFDFEWTCIRLLLREGQGVADLGNALLDLLGDRQHIDEAAPIRTNEAEMQVGVTICKGLHCCEMQMSFYAEESQACAVDFERLWGDELAFLCVFELAKRHFKERGWGVLGDDPAVEELGSGPASLCGNPCALRPKGEVAAMVVIPEMEEMQADSAVVLARIAQDPLERGHMVGDPLVFDKIRKLVKSDRLEVAWATACLLEALERVESKPEPLVRFLEGLGREVQEKVDSDYTEVAVQNLLRRVFFREDRGCKRQRG